MLGECKARIEIMQEAPLLPEARKELLRVTLKRGVLATTAIEGNSVTEAEYDEIILKKKDLPPSRKYQQTEIENMIGAFNDIISSIIRDNTDELITPDLIKNFHKKVISNLGDEAPAVPGQFRNNNVTVGRYRPPNYQDVPKLMVEYCNWLKAYSLTHDASKIENAIVKAISAHVYFEWIHPFGDGNGRTGRLIEYYILMRSGFPLIAGHILSNFYNDTRDKYYRMFETCKEKRSLTPFFEYAIEGLRDGLAETYLKVNKSQIFVFWQRVIYDTFDQIPYTKQEPHKRKRQVMLNFPLEEGVELKDIPLKTGVLAYGGLSYNTLYKDIKEIEGEGLLFFENNKFHANWRRICGEYFDPTIINSL